MTDIRNWKSEKKRSLKWELFDFELKSQILEVGRGNAEFGKVNAKGREPGV
jgi:hypothetical protein